MLRRTPLKRTAGLKANAVLRSGGSRKPAQRRDTGPPRSTRKLVREQRAQGCCERCGHRGGQIHHRDPRGMGGSSRPETNRPSNLVLLCVTCHSDVESNRTAAVADGYLIRDNGDPRATPVRMWHQGVFSRWLLRDDGTAAEVPGNCTVDCAVWKSNDPCDCGEETT